MTIVDDDMNWPMTNLTIDANHEATIANDAHTVAPTSGSRDEQEPRSGGADR